MTVSRALYQAGMSAAEKEEKPRRLPKNIKDCLEFAKQHKDWTVDYWKHVIWTDETKISRFCLDGCSWYWKRDGESEQSCRVKKTVKCGEGSIMIWGCMTARGRGYVCKIVGTMNQYFYKNILEDELMATIEWYGFDPSRMIFHHDNDSKHTAKSVRGGSTNKNSQC
jgi:hypothetical protein